MTGVDAVRSRRTQFFYTWISPQDCLSVLLTWWRPPCRGGEQRECKEKATVCFKTLEASESTHTVTFTVFWWLLRSALLRTGEGQEGQLSYLEAKMELIQCLENWDLKGKNQTFILHFLCELPHLKYKDKENSKVKKLKNVYTMHILTKRNLV